jgi:hypothetical protein
MLDIIVPVSPRTNGCPEKPGAPHLMLLIVVTGDQTAAIAVSFEPNTLR